MKNHPESFLLESYASGSIDAVSGLVVSTHLETCAICREKVAQLEAQSATMMSSPEAVYDADFDAMFEDITSLEVSKTGVKLRPERFVDVNGKSFKLPDTLSRFADNLGEWKSYGGKVFSANFGIDEDASISLLYISEDVQVPEHTHKGLESTLVLHGGFSDEDGHYHPGDLLIRDASTKHTPYTKKGEDCLCLTVLTEPMLFTKGVARLFNRFGKGMYP